MLLTLQQQTAPSTYSPTGGYVDTAALPTSAETTIRGQLMHPHNGTPWVGAKIRWKFIGFATTATTQRPSDSGVITTGENGIWEIRLWNNSEGDQDSHYLFKFPNDVEIKIYLAAGTPSPIEFSALAIAQTPPSDPSYPSLIELIDSKLADLGIAPTQDITVPAATILSGQMVVVATSTGAAPGNNNDLTHLGKVLGVTTGAVAQGASATIRPDGVMQENSWNWAIAPLYLGLNGQLTQTVPTAPGAIFVQEIAIALSPTRILINPQPAFLLA